MKYALLIVILAALMLSGCGSETTYREVRLIEKLHPDCEISLLYQRHSVSYFLIRQPDGAVLLRAAWIGRGNEVVSDRANVIFNKKN